MFSRYSKNIKKYIRNRRLNLKNEGGFSLVEVIVVFFIISIVAVVLVRGTMVSVDTLKTNKGKTTAISVANEKIEFIKAMNYGDIELTSENPTWGEENPALVEDGYDISYKVTEVYEGESGKYKQLEVSIFKEPMNVPISIITQIYPVMGIEEENIEHPAPLNLEIEYDEFIGGEREIKLIWEAPEAELEIDKYNIYRGTVYLSSAFVELFIDKPGDDKVYSYFVKTLYEDSVESVPSNVVNTVGEYDYPPPQNLLIAGYTQGGNSRRVLLEWQPPDTQLTIDRYIVYRDGEEVEVDWTGETSCSHRIGKIDYTFFVRAVYEGDIFSVPSNEVTTEP